ncbi:MAG: Gfo/Idh/MocA family oxidoreductase [marine benthic group bacterium]|nr:Gfo/Idh/MocA family oxidoreductase [Candidatus Benthicola marisminoris]
MSDEIRNGDEELFDDADLQEGEAPTEGAAEPDPEPVTEPASEPPADDPTPPPPPPVEPPPSRSGGIGRRDLVKALATVPVIGALGYSALRRKGLADDERERLLAELGIEDEGSAVFSELTTMTHPDTLRIGIVGYGGEGESLIRSLGFAHPDWIQARREAKIENPRDTWLDEWLEQENLNLELTAVCDVFDVRAERAIAASTQPIRPGGDTRQLKPAKRYRHYEELCNAPDVDAVIIATPDHLHSPITVAAANAGKHVYCEKCMTRTEEGVWPMADAVKQSGIVFQLGHQNRQMESHEKAREVVDKGVLGPITLVETTTNRNDPWGAWVWDIHEDGNPRTIDWELFQENAGNEVPFSLERFFRWRCWYDYGTGLSGDLLSHEYDAINQVLNLGIPHSAVASGGVYFFKDGRDVPDVWQAVFEYPDRDLTLIYSSTLANGRDRGIVMMGHDASMEVGTRLKVTADGSSTRYQEMLEEGLVRRDRPMLTYQSGFKGVDAVTTPTQEYFASRGLLFTYRGGRRVSTYYLHLREWLNAIRYGGDTSCNIDRGIEEAITCHMATKSYLEGRRVYWDPIQRKIV